MKIQTLEICLIIIIKIYYVKIIHRHFVRDDVRKLRRESKIQHTSHLHFQKQQCTFIFKNLENVVGLRFNNFGR